MPFARFPRRASAWLLVVPAWWAMWSTDLRPVSSSWSTNRMSGATLAQAHLSSHPLQEWGKAEDAVSGRVAAVDVGEFSRQVYGTLSLLNSEA